MFQIEYAPLPAVQPYLERIHYNGNICPTLETLNALIYAHQCSVPFETLDCSDYKKKVSLDVEHLYEKVVIHRRGGYCFELNGIFMALLRALGFDAYSCYCRTATRGTIAKPINHRGILVRLDGILYFCDVGFGGPMPPFAVRVCETKQTVRNETYWAERLKDDGWYLLRRYSGSGITDNGEDQNQEKNVMVFSCFAALAGDFEPISREFSSSSDSLFTKERRISLRTENGYISLNNRTFTVCDNRKTTSRDIPEEEISALLYDVFHLEPCDYQK